MKVINKKDIIRQKILKKRLLLNEKFINEKSEIIIQKIQKSKLYTSSKKILIYYPFKNEVNILALTKDKTKQYYLPLVENDELHYGEYSPNSKLKIGKFQIPETNKSKDNCIFDIIFIPGIAFDLNKNRIGYGKGFFDKFLKYTDKKTQKIAVAFDFQIIPKIETEKHDIKCDIIITEEKTYI